MKCPLYLYKYIGVNDWFFPDPTLRYTPIAELNDLYEGLPRIDPQITFDYVKELCNSNNFYPSDQVINNNIEFLKNDLINNAHFLMADVHKKFQIGVLCLSEDPTNSVMWGLYGSSNKGIVLKLDMSHELFQPNNLKLQSPFRPVKYSQRPVMKGVGGSGKDILNILFTKHKEWKFEKEWRSYRFFIDHLCASKNVKGTISLPPEAINTIYLGVRAEDSHKFIQDAQNFCSKNNIPCKKMEYHPAHYQVKIPR